MAWFIAALLIALAAIVLLFDLVPVFRTWLARIHIGRYEDAAGWEEAVRRTAVRWVGRTPTVKLTDQSRLVLVDRLRGQYSRSSIQQWQEGALLLGLGEALRLRPDGDAARELRRYLARRFLPDGSWRQPPENVDAAILAYAVMKLPKVDANHFRPAFDAVWAMIRRHLGEDGTAGYRKAMMSYRYVDTVGFICPFLTAYGVRFGRSECVELALRQLREFERHGLHPGLGIPCHAYQVDTRAPLGLYGWGRGLAWFALGLADTLSELPGAHPARPELTQMVAAYARAVLRLQQPSGAWTWAATRPEAAADSSATAALAWFLARAPLIGAASEAGTASSISSVGLAGSSGPANSASLASSASSTSSVGPASPASSISPAGSGSLATSASAGAERALAYLMRVTRRSGEIDFSQGDTKDIGVYSARFDILPFTQGFALRAHYALNESKEMNRGHDSQARELCKSPAEPLAI